jgi:hypothetical protein
MNEPSCAHRTLALVYDPSRYEMQARCADCDRRLGAFPDSEYVNDPAGQTIWAESLGLDPVLLQAVRRRVAGHV